MEFKSRVSIPRIECGNLTSSGFLVSNDKVITALHAIKAYLTKEVDIIKVVFIDEQGGETEFNAKPLVSIEGWEEYQIICLQLNQQVNNIDYFKCVDYRFYSTTETLTYGYPAVAKEKGTSIDLEIRNEFKNVDIDYGSNLDVKVKSDAIKNYKGYSGGPLLYNNHAVAVMLEQVSEDNEASRLCAVSLYIYKEYLESIGIPLVTKKHKAEYEEYILALKNTLQQQLENNLKRSIEKNKVNPLGFAISIQPKKSAKEDISFNKILEDDQSVMILSKPGGGKTYLLHMLMLDIIENPQVAIGKIPIFLKAKEWHRGYKNIVEGIRKELEYYSPNINDDQIIQALKAGNYILLIDGLDEVIINKDLFNREVQKVSQFRKTKIIMTCRQQNYHNEFYSIMTEYKLKPLSDTQIKEYLEGVLGESVQYGYIHELKKQLKDLITNPLFLYMTAYIMKEITNKVIPKNKSELYEVFISYIMHERLMMDGMNFKMEFEFEIKLEILMEFAYLNFREKNNSVKLRDVVSSRIEEQVNFNLIKNEIIQTGILIEERNSIEFFHPSIEEYFVALKLSKLSKHEISDFIDSNYLNEGYYEVLKFTSGLLRNYQQQNFILDKLETKDIYLYRQCLESRFSFNNDVDKIWSKDYIDEYFQQIRKSYINIIDSFFPNIKREFYPWCRENQFSNDHVAIVGALDRSRLTLSIEIIINNIDERTIIVSEEAGSATMEYRDNEGNVISTPIISLHSSNHWYFNLRQIDFGLDSAREVSLFIIKKQLKEILDKQRLLEHESLFALVPCIEFMLNSLPKRYFSIEQESISLYRHTNEEIQKVLTYGDNLTKYVESRGSYGSLSGEYITSLIYMLFKLLEANVKFKEYLLPQSDLEPPNNSYWVWEVWSDERLIKRLSKFFEAFQIAYRSLVESCFTAFSRVMPLYSMGPVRYNISYERINEGYGGGGISYSWEPVENMDEAKTIVKRGRELSPDFEKMQVNLNLSLKRLGRKGVGGYSHSSSALGSYIGEDRELRNKVYEKIKKDLEYVLGKLK